MAEVLDAWFLVAFRFTCGVAGLGIVVGGAAYCLFWALERLLCVAAIMEAVKEARQQGRGPILKAWQWWRG